MVLLWQLFPFSRGTNLNDDSVPLDLELDPDDGDTDTVPSVLTIEFLSGSGGEAGETSSLSFVCTSLLVSVWNIVPAK